KGIQSLIANFASRNQRIRGGVVSDDLILDNIDGFVEPLAEERQVARKRVYFGAQMREHEVGCDQESNADPQVDRGDSDGTFNHGALGDFYYRVDRIGEGGRQKQKQDKILRYIHEKSDNRDCQGPCNRRWWHY